MSLNTKINICVFLIFILLFLISIVTHFDNKNKNISFLLNNIFLVRERDINNLQKIINNTTAEGVIVYDVKNNKILGQKNIDKSYSIASLTKIITGYLAYEKDRTLLNDIRYMMSTSDNMAAEKISEVFSSSTIERVNYINNRTKKYNLYFRNVSGLDIILDRGRLSGGEGKPEDVINFIRDYYNQYPEIFDQTLIQENNTNIIVKDLDFLTGSKTGFTNLSGGNLFVSIQKGLGRDIFILVLNSTEKNRFVDVQNIANFLLQSSI